MQRTSIGQPSPAGSVDRSFERSTAGEHGIQPSGWFDDIVRTVSTVAPPLLGALGV
ncbi:MAG TPA: hypothetical protein VGN42_21885 [Pirellulales bacterium]|nr:hypothetical protein [Pirellulales bacterium]